MRTRLPLSLLGVALALLWLTPLAWAIDTSIKPEGETTRVPVTWIPDVFTLDATAACSPPVTCRSGCSTARSWHPA